MKEYRFDTFLSYSSRDELFVNKLWEDLRKNEINVWIDKDSLLAGDLFVDAIERGLNESRSVCIVISPESIKSNWVREEYLRAIDICVRSEQQRKVIPLILKDAEIPGFLSNRQWVDFSDAAKYSDSLTYLIKGIKYSTPLLEKEEGLIGLNELLRSANQSLVISGHTLDKFTEQSEIRATLLAALSSDVKVTIVLINPFCDYSFAHEPFHMLESRSPSQEQIANSIRVLHNIFSVANFPKNLTVLLSSYMPRFRTIIIDDTTIQISLYMFGADVGVAPEFTLSRFEKSIERSWFDAIASSTQQLINSKHVIPVIHDGVFHRNWENTKYSFQMKNCLAKSCCQLGDNCWACIQDSILGYQNFNRGEKAVSLYRLVERNFSPGLFTLSEINRSARFITPQTDYDNWLRNAVDEEMRLIKTNKPDLVNDVNFREIFDEVKSIFNLKTSSGKALYELTCYQEYSDILHRIIMTLLTNNPDYEVELYSNLTIDRTSLIQNVIRLLEKDRSLGLRDWLHLSIAAGLLGIDCKTVNAATSAFDKTVGISLGHARGDQAGEVERIARELVSAARTPQRIDASDFFFHLLNTNSIYPLKIVSFPDDYIESLFLLKFYELLINKYKMVSVDFIPKSVPCSNDITYDHVMAVISAFRGLQNNPRFRVVKDGPKTGGVNILKLSEEVWRRIADAFIIDVRGARNYEMMQGLKKQMFFGFMVCRDFSVAISGLSPRERPLVFIRHLQGERSFDGFKQRYLRKNPDGYMLARKTIVDKKDSWIGGHIAQMVESIGSHASERWQVLAKYYSANALDFDKKWGGVLEDEVKTYLDRLSGRILVLGCGSGKEVNYLAGHTKTKTIFGLDFSSEAILIARKNFPDLRDNFFVEDIYNVERVLSGEFDAVVANASLLHLLERDDLKMVLQQIRGRLREQGLLFVRVVHKVGCAPIDINDDSLQDLITPAVKESLKEYVYKDRRGAFVNTDDLVQLNKSGILSSPAFQKLLSVANPLNEEMDGYEEDKGEVRWFVYYTPDELSDIFLASGYKIKEGITVHPHHSVPTVTWLSALLEK